MEEKIEFIKQKLDWVSEILKKEDITQEDAQKALMHLHDVQMMSDELLLGDYTI